MVNETTFGGIYSIDSVTWHQLN